MGKDNVWFLPWRIAKYSSYVYFAMINEIKIISKNKIDDSLTTFEVESPYPLPNEMRIGIDPGTVNLGIAVVKPNNKIVTLYKITLKRHKKALNRLLDVQQVLGHTIGYFSGNSIAIIEGASYGATYRQVELAEVRAAMMLWFHEHNIEPHLVPPSTIRKSSFGSGKIKNPWSNLDDDLVAAIGCAFYTIPKEE
jgi:Holliday junction resolvasome RuvABC endonuclease subunit